jgi:glycine/D-amino acid oxidase-like deaminating enzyme
MVRIMHNWRLASGASMAKSEMLHADFKEAPYWWEDYKPTAGDLVVVPAKARVAIVGAGYAGLSCAIELADAGIDSVVLEAAELGYGASTRSGGAVSGGVNIGKSFTGRNSMIDPDVAKVLLASASDAFSLIESLIAREMIECCWEKRGRFVGAWTPWDYRVQEQRIAALNDAAASGSYMVPRERQREEMASDYYYGGMVVERSGKLHPALYYKGLLDAARRRQDLAVCARAAALSITRSGNGWRILTSRGTVDVGDVVIATNGYTGDVTRQLKRRLIPLASHIIATEELPPDLASALIPKGRSLSDTKRVLCYYRMSPDGKRVIIGGRARFTPVAPSLSAAPRHQDHARVDGERSIHLGCAATHGAVRRHALCAWLQRQRCSHDDLSRLPNRPPHHWWGQPHLRLRACPLPRFSSL